MKTRGSGTDRRNGGGPEDGMALVMALMVLLVLTVIGAALMANVNTETKISGYKVRDTQALALAEAGYQEAVLRIRNGDVTDNGNPRAVTIIFNQAAGSLPPVGADTTALATLQASGAYLKYSTSNKSTQMLTIKYKTKMGVIQRYDDTKNPKINTLTGNPIWVINATGTQGTSSRQIYGEVTATRFNVLTRGAVAADVSIAFKGNINICGHDHRMDTPAMVGPPACNVGVGTWLAPTAHTTCLPGAWTTKMISKQGSPGIIGEPSNEKTAQLGFYSGPWDCLGLTQAEFWPWIGPAFAIEPVNPKGLIYLDNNNVKQDQSGDFTFNSGDGEGLLYVDGDLQLNGNFTYRGLIYCEGDLTINGNCWILGGIVVKGKAVVKIANGSAIVLYSGEAIQQKISKWGGNLRTIAWREVEPD